MRGNKAHDAHHRLTKRSTNKSLVYTGSTCETEGHKTELERSKSCISLISYIKSPD